MYLEFFIMGVLVAEPALFYELVNLLIQCHFVDLRKDTYWRSIILLNKKYENIIVL
jgi:hypothetical protein